MTRLLVEVADFVAAARVMRDRVADPVDVILAEVGTTLCGLGAMAGDDPGGQAWAHSYDAAARAALTATQQIGDAAYTTSAMFGRSGSNYARADAASTTSVRTSITELIRTLPALSSCVPAVTLPSAAGGSGATPSGWDLVRHLIGYVWPDGHQDRLLRASRVWFDGADRLEAASSQAALAPAGFEGDRLPEADDMATVCNGLCRHLVDLASAYRGLGRACVDLAHHIDECHRAVVTELNDLLVWTAAIQTGGALLSVVTVGIAEAPAQAIQFAKIAAVARRVEGLILLCVDAARALADTLPSVAMAAERVRMAMEGLSGARLAVAGMESVPALRAAGAATKGVKLTKEAQAEIAATERLAKATAADVRHSVLENIEHPREFDPRSLQGMNSEALRSSIPKSWRSRVASHGEGTVFEDPANPGRQIRIMKGYPAGSRPDLITQGPYALISQNGERVKVALEGNPTL